MCGVRPYIRATCNPVPEDDRVGGWLTKLIAWWIDQETGYPIWTRSGVIRWFVRLNDAIVWGDSAEEFAARFPDVPAPDLRPKSLTFIPGTLDDNPALLRANPEYRANLLALPLVERERLLGGNWKIRPFAGMFDRAWFPIVDARPMEAQARCRFWDCAATAVSARSKDPDWTVGALVSRAWGGDTFYIEDIIRVRKTPGDVNRLIVDTAKTDGASVVIREEQEPGSAGVSVIAARRSMLAGYNYRGVPSTGAKATNWAPMLVQAEVGNMKMLQAPWNRPFLDEVASAPHGDHDDQLDAVSGAFKAVALETTASLAAGAMYPLYY
jgi:predicted phage terminase large subunit-like protein